MRPTDLIWVLLFGVTLMAWTHPIHAGPIATVLPGASDAEESAGYSGQLPGTDDGSSEEVPIGFTVNFFGQEYSNVFINNNGNITFGSALSDFTPFDLTTTNQQIIAPFFADVDTTSRGTVSYGTGSVDGRDAFSATWSEVGYYNARADKANTFQVMLINRDDIAPGDFDIQFNYETIEWETGDLSGGVNGLGGSSARVGFSNGSSDPNTAYELPGSAVNGAFLDTNTSGTALAFNSFNSDTPGEYIFFARGGSVLLNEPEGRDPMAPIDPVDPINPVDPSGPPTVPEPGTITLCGSGLLGLGAYLFRRRSKVEGRKV